MTEAERIAALKNADIFRSLPEQEIIRLSTRLQERTYPANMAIVREGSAGDAMFMIASGKVEIRKRAPESDFDVTITTLGSETCFGEMALLTGNPRSATVMAVESTKVLVLKKDDFDILLNQHQTLSAAISRIVAERIENMRNQKIPGTVSLNTLKLDEAVMACVPESVILKHKIIPTSYVNGKMTLAIVDPHDVTAIDEVQRIIKGKYPKAFFDRVIVTDEDLRLFMDSDYKTLVQPAREETIDIESFVDSMDHIQSDILKEFAFDDAEDDGGIPDIEKEAEGAPIIKLTNSIIAMALKKGASDIHIEPMEKEVRIRYRVDGDLHEDMILPKKIQLPLISRIKIISKLDITERRLPQDGRITIKMGNKSIDFRVSTVPAKFGEKICTRILDKTNTTLGLDKLISHPPVLNLVREMIKKPYGIIYVTGPTGSGKSTTLYSALAEINDVKRNISTVEDPIEYDLRGVNQIQVNHDIGLDFARVLRAFLRQDPDVILVGETRDMETAKIAVEAALTGHLVFTTLHANDAPGTFMRLTEMGIEPFLVSASIIGVIAQRLVRKICSNCKETYQDATAAQFIGLPGETPLYRGKGCDICGKTGYKGRVGVYEVLNVNEDIRHLIAEGANTLAIRDAALAAGMISLKEYCMILVKEGYITVEELVRTVVVSN
ncbi:MAG: ATPase, T2SS/T4P/T4SS family [Syntrophorhabdaceae bacterium]